MSTMNKGRFFCYIFSSIIFLTIIAIIGLYLLSFQKGLGVSYVTTNTRNLVKLFLSEGRHAPQKVAPNLQLITTYIRLTVDPLIFSSNKINKTSFLGYEISFFDYRDLKQLLAEIFMQNNYYFHSTKDKPFIIDCGSNIGISILYFKKLYPQSQIVGFEPSAKCFEVLKKNVVYNNLTDIALHQKALSKQEGLIPFFDDSSGEGALNASILSDKKQTKNVTQVESVRLSTFITKPVDLLKMDIEGAEREVLEELDEAQKLSLIKEMIIEYHHHIPDTNTDSMSSFLAILEKNGFGYQIRNSGINHPFGKKTSQGIIIFAYKK